MGIYTRTGDTGKTALIGARVFKDDLRVEAYGTTDELNSFIGKAMTELPEGEFVDLLEDLETIQHELFDCGGDLANVTEKRQEKLQPESIDRLEKRIDELMEEAPPLERFILPGGSGPSATLHIARTVARRAERQIVRLMNSGEAIPETGLRYINRLSDYLFAAARIINSRLGQPDTEYARSAKVFRNTGRKKDGSGGE
ncbi:cob(I)yrinic acid a,c-diamide adenosyltransferase [Bhargavaea cecembensis]|uniref:cob(I)yrinic acid a,c-diamide adenosyltransferase n=1 Tax=Bhargavaea cecembensis TaxID=394098 RepID=UPI0005911C89|nr:cob(I)yrinic acid a,c-diamide adenosyltransferase [Bhargavaea cecembensis]